VTPAVQRRARVSVGVLTVDDKAVFRDVAREVIEATAGFEPLGEASCGEEALALANELDPDLVLLDVRMPGIDGLETARRLSASHPESTVVLISSDSLEGSDAVECCGAAAFLRKQDFGPSTLRRVWREHGRPRPVEQGEDR
jgi:DNA-binding NarL/FixJ family response regulator